MAEATRLSHARRRLYDLPPQEISNMAATNSNEKDPHRLELLEYVRQNIIGTSKRFSSCFGTRSAIYCDYTASGRSLSFIEDFIASTVLPDYGNTHTTTTVTSLQTTLFRHEARDIVRNSVNASEHDAVIFTGSGCTAAVHKLIHALDFVKPPVVFVGPFEHHSNLLPWRELGAKVVMIEETSDGAVNIEHLEHELIAWHNCGRQLIGSFAAASNVTGILVDVDPITACLHRYGALALWDYATAAPYVEIDMNPVRTGPDQSLVYKDAVFISTHKFVGGVQTPGLLIAKKSLFRNPAPLHSGGGSVFFVRKDGHRYLQETEMREEGGTPAIVESIRAGLVFQLKDAVGTSIIQARDEQLCKRAFERLGSVEELILLGSRSVKRLPIFSFLIRHEESGSYLHYNFVSALLNDLFGIQARGGCACAGPYAQDLLGIDSKLALEYEDLLAEDSRLDRVHLRRYREYSDKEILRPGFTRLNLPYFEDDETIDFVLEALEIVAKHGWKVLPQYNFNPETGEWRHRNQQVFKDRKWLGNLSYSTGKLEYKQSADVSTGEGPISLKECLDTGRKLLSQATHSKVHLGDQSAMFDEDTIRFKWCLLPSEAYMWLRNPKQASRLPLHKVPFIPAVYPKSGPSVTTWTKCSCCHGDQASACPVHSFLARHSECSRNQSQSDNTLCNGNSADTFTKTEVDISPCNALQCSLPVSKCTTSAGGNERIDISLSNNLESPESSVTDSLSSCPINTTKSTQDTNVQCVPGKTDNEAVPSENSNVASHITEPISAQMKLGSEPQAAKKTKKVRNWHLPPKQIFKPMTEAIEQYQMLFDGDKVLVCLSGGKDSLSLLHSLRQYQFYAKKKSVNFSIGAVTIDPQTASYDPSPLKAYLKDLSTPYFYEEQCIMEAAKNLPYECASICSYCSRMKRGRIYAAARREGYNVLALGQHLDDLSESFLMSLFHNGLLRTMKASYTVQEGDLRVIRPFVHVREKDLRSFAEEKQLPIIAENCPACFEAPKERSRMKQLLAAQEILHPRLFHSIQAALSPLMAISKTGINMSKLLQNPVGDNVTIDTPDGKDIDEL